MNKKHEEHDEEQDEIEKEKPYVYYEQKVIRRYHHFYISTCIGEPQNYVEMIHQIRIASSEDTIYIHLNCGGGQLSTGVQIIHAIQNTKAHVICVLESEICSLATLIFLAGDEYIVQDHSRMMIHNFSGGGNSGKGHEQKAEFESTEKWFIGLAKDLYIPFISQKEFDSVLRGGDIWIHSEEIKTRLNNMVNNTKPSSNKPKR